MEDLVQDAEQNVLDRFGDDRPQGLRHRAPVLVQIVVGAVLCTKIIFKKNETSNNYKVESTLDVFWHLFLL